MPPQNPDPILELLGLTDDSTSGIDPPDVTDITSFEDLEAEAAAFNAAFDQFIADFGFSQDTEGNWSIDNADIVAILDFFDGLADNYPELGRYLDETSQDWGAILELLGLTGAESDDITPPDVSDITSFADLEEEAALFNAAFDQFIADF